MRFFPNVFVALERGFRVADILLVGGCSRCLISWRFAVTWRELA
jgi:hypothetical protein